MIRGIVRWSLQFRLLVIVIGAVLLIVGLLQLRTMPVDVLPEFTPPYVEIQTEALGLSAQEVEQMITVPLEQDLLNGVAWLDEIRSESLPGLSSIILIFDPGTDLLRARQMVQERMTQAFALPHVSKPPTMLQPLSASNRVMMIGLSSHEVSLLELGVLARWTIGPRLMGVPGVANVAIWGQRDRQLQVQVDPKRLREQGVSLEQVLETTGNAMWVSTLSFVEAAVPGTGGFIDTPQQRIGIRHIFPISSPEGLAKVPIEGSTLTLADVANVVEDHQPLIGDAITNDSPSLLLVVEKLPGANTLEVTQGLEKALAAMQPGLLGIEIDSSIYQPASYIEMATHNLGRLLLIGALLVLLVLLAFFFNWRTTLISLVAIPLSLVAAVYVLYWRGATFNMMILAGLAIALGALIDDAIIDVENIARRLRLPLPEGISRSPAAIILEAALEMRSPLIFATLIILLAVAPLFAIKGPSGAFFQPLVLSYGLALVTSLLVALTVTPALSLTLLANRQQPSSGERSDSPLVRGLQSGYAAILARTVRAPYLALLVAGVIILAGLAILPFLQRSLLPAFKEPNLLIHLDGVPGTSRTEMDRIVTQASRELRAIPGVRDVGAHVGRAVMSDQAVDVNASELWVSLDPGADYESTVAAINETVEGYPGLHHEVGTYLAERSNSVAAADKGIVVRVYGNDLAALRSTAEEVRQTLLGVKGVVDAQVKLPVEEPSLEVEVDLAAAQRYGIKPGDVRRAAAVLLSGLSVGNLFEEQKVFDVVVWGTPEVRSSLTSIRDLLLDTPSGEQVRLEDVAQVRIAPAPTVIQHEAVRSYLDIDVTVGGRALATVAGDIEKRIQGIKFPLEYHAEVLGESAERQAGLLQLLGTALAALIGIFLLLQAAYGSWRMAFVSFVTLPMALAGGVLAVLLGGGILSLGALAGFLAVLGIAVRNGMVMTTHFHYLEQIEGESFGQGLVLRGARERLGPVLMTALATGLALLPLVVAGDIAGNEVTHHMALVIMGGLITSTLLTLFILPALYLRFGSSPKPIMLDMPVSDQPGLGFA